MNKQDILSYLKRHMLTVISTCGEDHQPESALIGFGQTDGLELIIGTNTKTRKYKNIIQNPHVSLVIGWDSDNTSVQYEGIAKQLDDVQGDMYIAAYHKKVPTAARFRHEPGQVYFLITPTWIRYVDLKKGDGGNEEIKF